MFNLINDSCVTAFQATMRMWSCKLGPIQCVSPGAVNVELKTSEEGPSRLARSFANITDGSTEQPPRVRSTILRHEGASNGW